MHDSPFISSIITFIHTHNLLPQKSRIIVGLSGGPDSVFLLHLLASLRTTYAIELIAAHLDHEWRTESAQEALFCQTLCQQLNIPFVSKKISELTITIKKNGSQEEYARLLRRYFFAQIKNEYRADLIALAHHAQDQQETFFIRLMRGTSLTGLTAMLPKKNSYIRPLLKTDKADILSYLHTHTLPYCTDPSNESLNFLRNRIRHILTPALINCDKRFNQTFQKTLDQLQDAEAFLANLTLSLFQQATQIHNHQFMLNLPFFHSQESYMQYRLITLWLIKSNVPFTPTLSLLNEITRFLVQPGNKTHHMHHSWHIVKKQPLAFIHPL